MPKKGENNDAKNKDKIQENRRKIFELDVLVNSNKTKVEVCRAAVEQNYTAIMRNYNAAYMGNHNLLNQKLGRNSQAIDWRYWGTW